VTFTVIFAPEAIDRLDAIERYIADAGAPVAGADYVDAIVAFCQSLASLPLRGTRRDDLLPGLRITNYRGNAVVAFVVNETAKTVGIVVVFYGGQDYEAILQEA
jgi:toxin ParE1/3/4